MGWIGDRFWSHFVVAWVLTMAVITDLQSGPHPGLHALPMAMIASWAWALHCASDRRTEVAEGFRAQHHTWNSLLRTRPPQELSTLYSNAVQRMRSIEQHLLGVARTHRLQRLTIAFSDGWDPTSGGNEAAAVRDGRRAHVWLGSNWIAPGDAHHLPAVLEHELGHILRRDNERSTALQAVGVLLAVLAAAWLPLAPAAFVATTLRLLYTGWVWHSELACDARAVRTCGRDAVITLWRRNTDLLRTLPQPARLGLVLRASTTHPPYWLRLWWARHVSAPVALVPHPLAAPADASGQAPVVYLP